MGGGGREGGSKLELENTFFFFVDPLNPATFATAMGQNLTNQHSLSWKSLYCPISRFSALTQLWLRVILIII